MKKRSILFLFACVTAFAQKPSAEQTFTYTINWPSGLSLGESSITSRVNGDGMEYRMVLQAGFPGIPLRDEYVSKVNGSGCTTEFTKEAVHGTKKINEKLTFNGVGGLKRETPGGGGVSQAMVPACAHDGLGFLFFLQKELAQGRMPSSATVIMGAQYQLTLTPAGSQQITLGPDRLEADRFICKSKGPGSEQNFELFFLRDAARTLAIAKVQFPVGSFAMELVR